MQCLFRTIALAAAAIVVGAQPAGAQLVLGAGSRLVLAAVTDRDSHPLDLSPDDVSIAEDGSSREVLSVWRADYPVVVLLDNGLHAREDIGAIRDAATRFIGNIGDRPIAVGTLANPPAILASFDDDRSKVLERIARLEVSPTTVLMPLDAVAAGAQIVLDRGVPFAAIVVITARPMDAARPESLSIVNTIFNSRAVVHVVTRRLPASAPRGRQNRVRLEGDLLRELADQTGGQYTTVFSAPSYSVALDRLTERLATEVMVEYLVPSRTLPLPEYVQVGVRVPDARVRGLAVTH